MKRILSAVFSSTLVAGLALIGGCSGAEPIEGAEAPEVSAETGESGMSLGSADVTEDSLAEADEDAQGAEEISSEPAAEGETCTPVSHLETEALADEVASADNVHRKSAKCASPRGKRINISWGDGNISTTVYYNNHCDERRKIVLTFVRQNHWGLSEIYYRCIEAPARKKDKEKVGAARPVAVTIMKASDGDC
ncbi:hypothetical protein WME75_32840 [Sorangium sp. So ce1014]|uniref:hypothetical protein n=1 Tax=Sorangium sp. So ce1014 TaxID=3133326 RepID=UPI003F5D8769